MHTTPTKRHQAERTAPATPSDPNDPRGQMRTLIPDELRNALACSPKDRRAAVNGGYKHASPGGRAPLLSTRSEPSLSFSPSSGPSYASTSTSGMNDGPGRPPIFSTAQEVLHSVYESSPQRGLQPMFDTLDSADPWSPSRSRSPTAASASASTSASASASRSRTSYGSSSSAPGLRRTAASLQWSAQPSRIVKRGLTDEVDEGAETEEEEEDGDMDMDPPSPTRRTARKMVDRAVRPLRRLPLGGQQQQGGRIAGGGGGLQKTKSLPVDAFMMHHHSMDSWNTSTGPSESLSLSSSSAESSSASFSSSSASSKRTGGEDEWMRTDVPF